MKIGTPWGNASELKARRLSPGPGTPREEVIRNQRERIFAAMVAATAEKGYPATTVADVLALSGVSRTTFYEHFQDKENCFRATIEAAIDAGMEAVSQSYRDSDPWELRAQRGLETFIELIVAQPATAKMCLMEAYRAGTMGLTPIAQTIGEIEELGRLALKELPGRAGTPPELTRSILGGLHWVLYRHLYRGEEQELIGRTSELWEWAMSYQPPPRSLRPKGRRRSPSEGALPFTVHIPGERILRAFGAVVAEKGYAATKIADIAERAQISQATFYAHFENKLDALFAMLESSGAQMQAVTLPALRRASSGPEAVRVAMESICTFLAAEPAFGHLRAVEVYAIGPEAIERRSKTGEDLLKVVFSLGFKQEAQMTPIALEATIGALHTLLYDQVSRGLTQRLPEIAPLATYIALSPLLGAERACLAANGDGRSAHGTIS